MALNVQGQVGSLKQSAWIYIVKGHSLLDFNVYSILLSFSVSG